MEICIASVLQGIYAKTFPSCVQNFILNNELGEITGAIDNFYPIILIKNKHIPLFLFI